MRFQTATKWCGTLPEDAWTRLEVRDAEKGPLSVDIVKRSVSGRTEKKQVAPPETLVVIRWRDEEGVQKIDYYMSNAPVTTPLKEFARVSKLHTRIEQCIKRSKSEAGLCSVSSSQLERLASPYSTVAHCHLVSGARGAVGKKNGLQRSRSHRSARVVAVATPIHGLRYSRTNFQGSHSLVEAN